MTKFLLVLKEFLKLKNEEMIDNRAYLIVSSIICTMILVHLSVVLGWFDGIWVGDINLITLYFVNLWLIVIIIMVTALLLGLFGMLFSYIKDFFEWVGWNWKLAKSNVQDKLDEKKK